MEVRLSVCNRTSCKCSTGCLHAVWKLVIIFLLSLGFLNGSDLTKSYLLPHTTYCTFTVQPVCLFVYASDRMNALVYLCVLFFLSEIDRVKTVFILFNSSLISLVRNFNFCNKSASGHRSEEKLTHAR